MHCSEISAYLQRQPCLGNQAGLGCVLYTVDNGEFSISDPICTSQGDSGRPGSRMRGMDPLFPAVWTLLEPRGAPVWSARESTGPTKSPQLYGDSGGRGSSLQRCGQVPCGPSSPICTLASPRLALASVLPKAELKVCFPPPQGHWLGPLQLPCSRTLSATVPKTLDQPRGHHLHSLCRFLAGQS